MKATILLTILLSIVGCSKQEEPDWIPQTADELVVWSFQKNGRSPTEEERFQFCLMDTEGIKTEYKDGRPFRRTNIPSKLMN